MPRERLHDRIVRVDSFWRPAWLAVTVVSDHGTRGFQIIEGWFYQFADSLREHRVQWALAPIAPAQKPRRNRLRVRRGFRGHAAPVRAARSAANATASALVANVCPLNPPLSVTYPTAHWFGRLRAHDNSTTSPTS